MANTKENIRDWSIVALAPVIACLSMAGLLLIVDALVRAGR